MFKLPIIENLRGHSRQDVLHDAIAGATTAVLLVPQAMAYALLAGLPPEVGLYASFVPLLLYALLGSSRELAVGPVAIVSLLVASGIGSLAPVGTVQFVALAAVVAGLVGVIQLVLGLARAGFVVNFLSHPVISGFTSAAALIIGASQLKHVLGVDLPRSEYVHDTVIAAMRSLSEVHGPSVVTGTASLFALLALKRWRPLFPRALAVVVVGTVSVWAFDLHHSGIRIVGALPSGLPAPSLPDINIDQLGTLVGIAFAIALVGFMESVSVAKAFARKNGYDIEPNRELVALGTANLGAAVFGGYPVTGGFSRTAVNAQAGARSTLASLFTAGIVGLTLWFLTPLFFYLPKAILAAIILNAVIGLVDVAEVRHLWRVKKTDLALLGLTFVSTLAVGIEAGILIGVGASIGVFMVRTSRPHTAVLGYLPEGDCYRNIARYPHAQVTPGVLAVRMDASFYFGNVSFLKQTLKRLEAEASVPTTTVILDFSAINDLDSSADAALHELLTDYRRRDIRLVLARVKGPVMNVLKRSGFASRMAPGDFVDDVREAMAACSGGQSIGGSVCASHDATDESGCNPVTHGLGRS